MGIGGMLEQIFFPPGGLILLSLFGLVVMRKTRRVGFYITTTGLVLLYVVCLPFTATTLMSWLEPETALTEKFLAHSAQLDKPPQAIVILGAGRHYNTLEFESDSPNAYALERIRYGVWLARRTQLPILVSGGLGDEDILSEAEMIKNIIENEYALPVRWAEMKSRTTYENAKYSSAMLKAEGIESMYLVTHAGHMKRSVMSFEKFGLSIHPAPTVFKSTSQRGLSLRSFLPDVKALRRTVWVLHEWVGMVWYWVRY